MAEIEENVKHLLREIAGGNGYGERVTLVAATKTRTPEEINRAIAAGIEAVGENKVQEFREKYDFLRGGARHFIGNLQTNKIKYLTGKCDLIQSVGSFHLASEISRLSCRAGVIQNFLIEINVGSESSKGGFPYAEAESAYRAISALPNIRVKGFMAMLPEHGEKDVLVSLCKRMRRLFESVREEDGACEYLSMGMSGDYELCLENGSNMIRLGTAIFGERNYNRT